MGTVKSTIYSTTAAAPMTQLNFSTEYQECSAAVTVDLVKSGAVVKSETYSLDTNNTIAKIKLLDGKIISEGTVTYAAGGNAIAFSGVCVWGDVTSFKAENVAVAYR